VLTQKKNGKGTIYFVDENNAIVSKTCTKCNEVKTLDEFAENKEGLGNRRAKCLKCNNKGYASTKEYEVRKLTRVKLETRDGVSGKESQCKACRAKLGRNLRENNKEREAERIRTWRKANPEKEALKKQRRRAREKDLPDNFTKEQMSATFEYFGGCVLTGDNANIDWDHVIPLATGEVGTVFGNMIPLRSDLNKSKNDSNVFEWFASNKERFNLSQSKFDRLIEWLAECSDMTIEQYRTYTYKCFEKTA
jgi:ribosomal protein L24E